MAKEVDQKDERYRYLSKKWKPGSTHSQMPPQKKEKPLLKEEENLEWAEQVLEKDIRAKNEDFLGDSKESLCDAED